MVDIIGWIGSVEVIVAYGMISAKRVDSSSRFYQWLNMTGAIFLIINTIYYGAYPSTFINVVWVFIAIFALYNIARKKT